MSGATELPELEEFIALLGTADKPAARSLAMRVAADGGIWPVVDELIPRAMREVGARWEKSQWTVAQEHHATDICTGIVDSIWQSLDPLPPRAPVALLVCAEGEWHSLASLVVRVAMGAGGWRAVLLGPSVAASQLVAALYDIGPDFVAVTCSLPANLRGARRMIVTARDAGTPVIAGGRAFGDGERRALELGANAWVGSAEAMIDAGRNIGLLTEPAAPLRPELAPELRSLEAAWGHSVAILADRLGVAHAPDDDVASGGIWLLRTVGAALLCSEPDLVAAQLDWHQGRARLGGALPTEVVVRAVLEALPSRAATAQQWLLDAAAGVGIEV